MSDRLTINIDGRRVEVIVGTSVAAALMAIGKPPRRSITSGERAPLCGMGVCFECRVMIDGSPHQRSCLVPCREGMEIRTGE
jgi:D-hydroxyproline dehydrogenase subunit gamma